MSDAERAPWFRLRGKQVANFKFRRQHPFGDYILDFVCLEAMLAIEVDGGSMPNMPKRTRLDLHILSVLERAGFRVLRFWNNDVLNNIDAVTETIWNALQTNTPPPSQPSP